MDSREIIWQYDDEYYLGGRSKHTGKVILGVHGSKEFNLGKVAKRKSISCNMVDFKDKVILDVGFARGEMLKYCFDNGAKLCIGIDYSPSAYSIAKEYINDSKVHLYQLSVTDIDKINESEIEIIYLMDILEHVSTEEWHEFFKKLRNKVSSNCILIAETPCYKHGGYLDMHNNYFGLSSLETLFNQYFKDINIDKRDVHSPDFLAGKERVNERPTHFIIKAKNMK